MTVSSFFNQMMAYGVRRPTNRMQGCADIENIKRGDSLPIINVLKIKFNSMCQSFTSASSKYTHGMKLPNPPKSQQHS